MYKKIESEYNYYISSKKNEIGITEFKKKLAKTIGTTLSNIYEIIKVGLITVYNYDLTERTEFSAEVAYQKRTKKSMESNSSKRISSKPFVQLIIKELRNDYNINSVDEIIHDLDLFLEDFVRNFQIIESFKEGEVHSVSKSEVNEMLHYKYDRLPLFERMDEIAKWLSSHFYKGSSKKVRTFAKLLREHANFKKDYKDCIFEKHGGIPPPQD